MSSSPSKKLVNCFWIKAGCDVCEKWTVVFFLKKEWKWDTYIRNKIRRGRCPLLVKFVFQIQRLGPRAGQAAVNPSQNTWNGLAYHWNDKQSNFSNISTSSKKKKFCLSGLWCCWDQENRQKEKKKKPRVRSTRLPPLVLSANHVTRVQGKDNVSLARLIQKGGKRRRDQPLVSKIFFFFFSKRFVSSWLCLLSRLRLVVECGRVASFVCEEEMTTDKSVKSSRSDKRRVCKCCSTFPRYSISQICFHLSRKDQQAVDGEKTSSADQSQSVCSQVAHYQRRSRSRHTHAFSWYYYKCKYSIYLSRYRKRPTVPIPLRNRGWRRRTFSNWQSCICGRWRSRKRSTCNSNNNTSWNSLKKKAAVSTVTSNRIDLAIKRVATTLYASWTVRTWQKNGWWSTSESESRTFPNRTRAAIRRMSMLSPRQDCQTAV